MSTIKDTLENLQIEAKSYGLFYVFDDVKKWKTLYNSKGLKIKQEALDRLKEKAKESIELIQLAQDEYNKEIDIFLSKKKRPKYMDYTDVDLYKRAARIYQKLLIIASIKMSEK